MASSVRTVCAMWNALPHHPSVTCESVPTRQKAGEWGFEWMGEVWLWISVYLLSTDILCFCCCVCCGVLVVVMC